MRKNINLLFVTFFFTGYIKIASGTFASLFISIILFYIFRFLSFENFQVMCFATVLIFVYSLYSIETLKNEFEEIDASEIVIDEVVGQTIPILTIEYITFSQTGTFGANPLIYIVSFFLFRFFDIFKPFFISHFDKKYKNSFGVILDDVVAGLYVVLTLIIFMILKSKFFL